MVLKSGQGIEHHISAFQLVANSGRRSWERILSEVPTTLVHPSHPSWRQPWSRGCPIVPSQAIPGICPSALGTAEWKEQEKEIRAGFWRLLC